MTITKINRVSMTFCRIFGRINGNLIALLCKEFMRQTEALPRRLLRANVISRQGWKRGQRFSERLPSNRHNLAVITPE